MIITRTGDVVEFRVGEDKPIRINVSGIASAALSAERGPNGKLGLVLTLSGSAGPQRIVAGPIALAAMHARIVEVMHETNGPAMPPPCAHPVSAETFPY